VTKRALQAIKEYGKENVEVIAVGKKAVTQLSTFGVKPKMAYEKKDSARKATSVVNIANYAYEEFKSEKVDKVVIVYNHFVSSLVQEPVLRSLFPFSKEEGTRAGIEELTEKKESVTAVESLPTADYIHDPSKRQVLSYLVPRLGEVQLFQALLESNASEHSARMLAMKNASEAAGEMQDDLTLIYNRARQAAITQEIAEISAGMAAVT
jgi:F-type H+-transporting ATPase subunit gamma